MLKNTPIAVKKALKMGIYKKEYNFHVLDSNGTVDFVINNDTLVAESVYIDERMATGSDLVFGLCEGASLEFQYFNHPNINGRRIKALLKVQYVNANNALAWYTIPMGYFTVKECPRQFSTGIYKATCYNQLQSDYLDAKANELLIDAYNNQDSYSPSNIEKLLNIALADYKIDTHFEDGFRIYSDISSNKSSLSLAQTIDLEVYEDNGGGVVETHYLHGLCPFLRVRFNNAGHHMFKIHDFYTSNIISVVQNAAGMPQQLYENYRLTSTQEFFYDWLTATNGTVSDIRAGIFDYSYMDASNTAHLVNDYIYDSDDLFPTPYYWSINTQTATGGGEYQFRFFCPVYWIMDDSPTYTWTAVSNTVFQEIRTRIDNLLNEFFVSNDLVLWVQKTSAGSDMPVGPEIETWPDVTLRELQSAIYELDCQYGQLDRETDEFKGVELNGGGLYPAETLYPANSLRPNSNTGGEGIHPYPSEYSQLWTDTMGEQSFRYLFITYKTLDENNQEIEDVLQRTVNADGTTDYNMSDNWLFRNLVWTAADVGDYADAMVTKMQDIRWFPFEMWAAGLPYVETGDAIEITDREGNTHNSYILQRQLQGIQNLQDTYVNGELDIF